MDVKKFFSTIYLGDRYCVETKYDKKDNFFTIQMNGISRIRSTDGQWNFYTDEDIMDGLIVFSGVKKIECGRAPFELNDEIYDIQAAVINDVLYEFTVSGRYVHDSGYAEGAIRIIAKDVYLIDPKNPSVQIRA